MNKLFKTAFTLIELLVVIAIIGILSGLIVVSMNGSINSANDAKRKAGIDTIRKALIFYATLNGGSYPISSSCTVGGSCSFPSSFSEFLPVIPTDPVSNGYYTYVSNGTSFTIYALLSSTSLYSYSSLSGFASSFGSSCLSTLNAGKSTGSGTYWINLSGTFLPVYCDMTTDGGGWTLIAGIAMNNAHDTAAAVTPENIISISGVGKLSDVTINAIRTSSGSEGIVRLKCGSSTDYFDYRTTSWHADYNGYPNGTGWDVYTQPWGAAPYTGGGASYPNNPGCWAYSVWGQSTIYGYSGWTGCYTGSTQATGTTWIR
ncbi:MAG: fibrinogen-like YCDxxxxGGGW domain-containing protein [Candidatus Paceibacterota bacterium]|jgi:prepilin-type N-terminal cleavage/methylation domain-containing protein